VAIYVYGYGYGELSVGSAIHQRLTRSVTPSAPIKRLERLSAPVCTLALAWQVFPEAPVVVAANRDERYARTAEPPTVIETDPTVVAPRDATAGGTWIGYNDAGLFVGITNRWVEGLDAERSRGLLVREALRSPDAESAVTTVERALEAADYDGFNLLVADANAAFLLEWDGRLRRRRLDPGVHVLVNVGSSDDVTLPSSDRRRGLAQAINARSVRSALEPKAEEHAGAWLDRAATVLSDHDYGVCLHNDDFGTVSTSLIQLGSDGDARYEYAAGPPCTTAFERVDVGGL
jgi:uncharacterized protein with NRDE domain